MVTEYFLFKFLNIRVSQFFQSRISIFLPDKLFRTYNPHRHALDLTLFSNLRSTRWTTRFILNLLFPPNLSNWTKEYHPYWRWDNSLFWPSTWKPPISPISLAWRKGREFPWLQWLWWKGNSSKSLPCRRPLDALKRCMIDLFDQTQRRR